MCASSAWICACVHCVFSSSGSSITAVRPQSLGQVGFEMQQERRNTGMTEARNAPFKDVFLMQRAARTDVQTQPANIQMSNCKLPDKHALSSLLSVFSSSLCSLSYFSRGQGGELTVGQYKPVPV